MLSAGMATELDQGSLDAEETVYGQVYSNAWAMELLKPITCERRMSGAPFRIGELVTARDMLPGYDPPRHTKETENICWQGCLCQPAFTGDRKCGPATDTKGTKRIQTCFSSAGRVVRGEACAQAPCCSVT